MPPVRGFTRLHCRGDGITLYDFFCCCFLVCLNSEGLNLSVKDDRLYSPGPGLSLEFTPSLFSPYPNPIFLKLLGWTISVLTEYSKGLGKNECFSRNSIRPGNRFPIENLGDLDLANCWSGLYAFGAGIFR